MAPEQVEDHPGQPLDFRCDLFAFGVTLYEAATGINPFEGRSLFTTLENIKRIEPATPDQPGPAAPLLIIAAVNVAVVVVIEPASEADAFPDDHSLADAPATHPLSGPPPSGPQV